MFQPGLVWRDATDYYETTPPKVPWIVEGFCAVGAVTVLVGDPGIGKSFLALTMAAAASHGLPVLGMNTLISEVAYLDAENGEGEMHRRICALGLRSNARVAVAPGGFDLTASMYQVEDAVSPVTVRLLILDSFRSLMPNVDENSSQEVSEALVPIQHLARQYGVAVVLLHHRSKAGSLRGSTAFQSTAEIVVHLVKGKHGEELSLVWEKSRMGRKPRRRDLVLTEQGAV